MSNTSWRIKFNFPVYLQFSGYIALQEKFSLNTTAATSKQAEFEWRTWWRSLLNISPDLSNANSNPQLTVNFTPPTFTDVENLSEIQTLCHLHWSKFHDQWIQGVKRNNNSKMREQIQRLRIEKMIRDCAKKLGKNHTITFNLIVDFVQYPVVYVQSVRKEYIVVNSQFTDPSMLKDFREVLYQQIANIIQSD